MLALSTFGVAQRSGLFSETLSTAGVGSQSLNTIASASSTYMLSYDTTGTPGAVSIQLEGSTDSTTFALCGSAATNTTAGSATCTGTFQKIRANLTSLTGGASPTVTYAIAASYGTGGTGTNATQIQGADPATSAPTANPVSIGGLDTPNNFIRRYCAFTATADRSTSYGAGTCSNQFALSAGGNLYDRPESASSTNLIAATTLTSRNSAGAQLSEKGSRWTVISNPAAGVVASASIALESGVKHIVDTVCFSAGSVAAPAATSLQVNVRDGATGAGTVIGVFEIDIPAAAGQNLIPTCVSNLNLVGTTGTAMTAEFSAGLANLKESVFITGHNVN